MDRWGVGTVVTDEAALDDNQMKRWLKKTDQIV